ncbi:MAG TPA: hypothetical protein VF516_03520 [Kofleriaceae bacterium]
MSPWLAAAEGPGGQLGRALDRPPFGIAPMMVDVVDQRHLESLADRQQILDGVHPIVVLQHDPRTRPRRQARQPRGQAFEARALAAVRAAPGA